jgi:two-component system, OmpR family, sensor kinase
VLERLSLRARLILGVIALAAAGLLIADAVTYTSLRSFLISRTDGSLDAAHQSVEAALRGAAHGPAPAGASRQSKDHDSDDSRPPPGLGRTLAASVPGEFVQLRRTDGTIIATGGNAQFSGGDESPPPRLPRQIHVSGEEGADRVSYFTVPATGGDERYRVRASIEPGADNELLIVASSLGDVDSTLHRLLLVAALVTLGALGGIALLGTWVIRLGLRPLTAIGATAATIAAGDLSRRVGREDERTEVGRLGAALNAMLGRIEAAFRAQEASERKLRRFVADASHELRTPLAAVRAYSELFTRGAADRPADLARSMTGISRESERMSLLVEDLLLLARLDEGRPLAREPVELRDVVEESIETSRLVEPSRTIDCDLESATVNGDHVRLRQVVDNLLANVRAHAGADASVEVKLRRDGAVARLTVADTGPGMDPEHATHAFERFYRADTSRTRASGGAGLGLSIAAAVVEAHNGRAVASSTGAGATFSIELPLASS